MLLEAVAQEALLLDVITRIVLNWILAIVALVLENVLYSVVLIAMLHWALV